MAPALADPLQLCELSVAIATLQKLIPEHFTNYRPLPRRLCSIAPYKIVVVSDKKTQKTQKQTNKKNPKTHKQKKPVGV